MEWDSASAAGWAWPETIANLAAKEAAAARLAARLRDGDVVGVGSGSTSYVSLRALAALATARGWRFLAIPTSLEMEMACAAHQVATTSLLRTRPDWSFDGADEIDPEGNMIKGRGGEMTRERLVMASSPERFVVIDKSKRVEKLGTRFPIPIEILPEAYRLVAERLRRDLGATEVTLRSALAKDGPVISEHGNLIADARFESVEATLDRAMSSLPGVVGTGLFVGFNPTVVTA